jgi:hypothetical protein
MAEISCRVFRKAKKQEKESLFSGQRRDYAESVFIRAEGV